MLIYKTGFMVTELVKFKYGGNNHGRADEKDRVSRTMQLLREEP
jgi:hypothetical protein